MCLHISYCLYLMDTLYPDFFASVLYLPCRGLPCFHLSRAAYLLVQAKLFPVHSCKNTGGPQQSTGNDNSEDSNGDHSNPAARILWMQNVRDTGTTSTTAASLPLPIPPPPNGDSDAEIATPGVVKSWLAAERLSFKDILRRAEPSAEFEWRRRLEEGMGKEDAAESTGDIPEAGCR